MAAVFSKFKIEVFLSFDTKLCKLSATQFRYFLIISPCRLERLLIDSVFVYCSWLCPETHRHGRWQTYYSSVMGHCR